MLDPFGRLRGRTNQQNSNTELELRRQGLWFAAGGSDDWSLPHQSKSPTPTVEGTTANQVSEMRLPTIADRQKAWDACCIQNPSDARQIYHALFENECKSLQRV